MGRTGTDAVHLTFDACGGTHGSGVDDVLLATLRRLRVPATLFLKTLFLNLRWIEANPTLATELAADEMFRVASHGVRHVPLSVTGRAAYGIRGMANAAEVYDELTGTDAWFAEHTGEAPGMFRPGTPHVDDVTCVTASRLGRTIIGFSINADAGATASAAQVSSALASARVGDIVIGHMNQPRGQTAEGVAAALPRMLDRV